MQVFARPANVMLRSLIRRVPTTHAPPLRVFSKAPPRELRVVAERERERWRARLLRLPLGSPLRAYEEAYGFDLGDSSGIRRHWSAGVALAPYPASVRARRLAVAVRLGEADLGLELARAARAVMLQPELHLLGNHLLENAFGLSCAGAVGTGPEADAWWALGRALLSWQLAEQFLLDGGHFERSASYHVALTLGLLETIHLGEAAGRDVPPEWMAVARRALAWIEAVRAPDDTYPLFNDAALDASAAIDDVLGLARALGYPTRPTNESPTTPARSGWTLTYLADTGWLLASTARDLFVLDAGPEGPRCQPGHVHADALTFELWVDGVRAIADYGVASYERGPQRDATRATRSHNTVTLDQHDSSEVWHAFRTGRLASSSLRTATSTASGVSIEASHDGFSWMPGGPVHVRKVEIEHRTLVVEDRVLDAECPFQSRLRLTRAGRTLLDVRGSGPIATREGEAWFPRHGDAEEATVLEQEARADQAIRWLIRF